MCVYTNTEEKEEEEKKNRYQTVERWSGSWGSKFRRYDPDDLKQVLIRYSVDELCAWEFGTTILVASLELVNTSNHNGWLFTKHSGGVPYTEWELVLYIYRHTVGIGKYTYVRVLDVVAYFEKTRFADKLFIYFLSSFSFTSPGVANRD